MHIVIVTPARPGSRHGNRNTAERWAAHMRALGHKIDITQTWAGEDCGVLVASHARRSHASIKGWNAAYHDRPFFSGARAQTPNGGRGSKLQ